MVVEKFSSVTHCFLWLLDSSLGGVHPAATRAALLIQYQNTRNVETCSGKSTAGGNTSHIRCWFIPHPIKHCTAYTFRLSDHQEGFQRGLFMRILLGVRAQGNTTTVLQGNSLIFPKVPYILVVLVFVIFSLYFPCAVIRKKMMTMIHNKNHIVLITYVYSFLNNHSFSTLA